MRKGLNYFRVIVLLFAFLVFGPAVSIVYSDPIVGMFDELVELYPDRTPEQMAGSYRIDVPRGTTAAVHLLLAGLGQKSDVSFSVTEDGRSVPDAMWYRMIDVPVEQNTGLDSRTEQFSGKTNPYVIRRAPFRIFEAFEPVNSPFKTEVPIAALRLEIPVVTDKAPNEYVYRITLKIDDRSENMTFYVNVHSATVPGVRESTLQYTNWFSNDRICSDHGVQKWSPQFWDILEKYAKLMAKGRQNTFWIKWQEFFKFEDNGKATLNRKNLERYVEVFRGAGFHTMEGAPFAGRKDGNWSSGQIQITQTAVLANSQKGKEQIADMAGQMMSVIRDNKWEKKWVQHIADEPTDVLAADYRLVAEQLRLYMPGIRIVEATMSTDLVGAVDIWCPQVQEYQKHREFFEERASAGDQVWVYTCLIPGGPWLNRLLDQERLRQVYIGWACAKYDLGGFLHWGLNHHSGKPFDQSVVHHNEGAANNFLPAGDSHIIYPGKTGPLSGQRFEAHRIGMEDYELLARLKSKNRQKAVEIIDIVFKAFDEYNKDIQTYRKARRALLEAVAGEL